MATDIEYALMAGRIYQTTRARINWLPDLLALKWQEKLYEVNDSSGFEAVSFQKGSEIVISFAGTGSNVDWWANAGGAFGVTSDQLRQAADYYLQIKTANPKASISFTGHSLGGGLASLMAVFFGQMATTFDQAPFRNSASVAVATTLKDYLVNQQGHSEAALQGLTNFINTAATGGIPGEGNVRDFSVQGEILSAASGLRIGTPTSLTHGAPDLTLTLDLHSQALLTAFLQSDQTASAQHSLRDVTFKLPDVVRMIFDNKLFAYSTANSNVTDENFIERLVRHQNGVAGLTTDEIAVLADAMATRFTADLWKLAQDGGMTLHDGNTSNADLNQVSKALIAFAMQKYYTETDASPSYKEELFQSETGGISFSLSDVATTLSEAKGSKYFADYLKQTNSGLSTDEQSIITAQLPELIDWFIQAGSQGMNASATTQRAFMLGGIGSDTLTGGATADLLVGNAGNDTLTGGTGTDTLLGGIGNDIYIYATGDGRDTIFDTDGAGSIVFNSGVLNGGAQYGSNHMYKGIDENNKEHIYVYLKGDNNTGGDLLVDGALTIKNFHNNNLGISLVAAAPAILPQTTNDIFNGGIFSDTSANDHIIGGTYSDIINVRNGGDNFIEGGNGDDAIYGYGGNDVIVGGAHGDTIYGGTGNNIIYGDERLDVETAIQYGNDPANGFHYSGWKGSAQFGLYFVSNYNYLYGGEGNDTLISGGGNDKLDGGMGSDLIIAGAGDDIVISSLSPLNVDGDVLYAGAGNDHVSCANGNDYVIAGGGNDVIAGNGGDDYIEAGDGNDKVVSGDGADILIGGYGNDILQGGSGDDVYIHNIGDGFDTIIDGAVTGEVNTLLFGDGITSNMISLSLGLLKFDFGNGDVIDIQNFYEGNVENGSTIQRFEFSDGTALTMQQLLERSFDSVATIGDDTLDGSAGADTMAGGLGDDTYVVNNIGDVVIEAASEGIDLVQSGVTYKLTENAENLTLTGTSAIDGAGNELDNVLNGNSAANTLSGNSGNDILNGGTGNDILTGGAGSDTYLINAGDGVDYVYDDILSGVNSLVFGAGVDPASIKLFQGSLGLDLGNGNIIHIDGVDYNDVANTSSIQRFQFADGSVLTAQQLVARGFDIRGTDGNDLISGTNVSDRIVGGLGNDTLTGGADADLYLFGRGDGQDTITDFNIAGTDKLMFGTGIATSDITASYLNNDLVIKVNDPNNAAATDQITIKNWNNRTDQTEQVQFADSTVWTAAILTDLSKLISPTMTMTGTDAAESLTLAADTIWFDAKAGDDTIVSGLGNTTIYGGDGNDTITDSGGNDTIYGGAGNDTITDSGGNDTIYGGAGNDTITDSDGTDLIDGGDGNDTITDTDGNYTIHGGAGNDTITASGGNGTIDGGAGDDTITASSGNGMIDGGTGDDTMSGGDGDDVYHVDTVGDIVAESENQGTDTVLTSVGYTLGANLEKLTLTGTIAIDGTGNELDNVLTGNSAANMLDGGAGADTMIGGMGDDTYALGRGYGADTVQENDVIEGNWDVLQFQSGIATDQIWLRKVADDLEVSIIGTTDNTTLSNWYLGDQYHVEQFKTSDGKTLLDSQVQSMVSAMAAFSPPAAGQTTLPANYAVSLNQMIVANWQ